MKFALYCPGCLECSELPQEGEEKERVIEAFVGGHFSHLKDGEFFEIVEEHAFPLYKRIAFLRRPRAPVMVH